jgi:hypothetical protein
METTTKYPEVRVQLTGKDGNAFMILGAVTNALKKAGVDKAERDAFYTEATADDYDHLLRTAMKWVAVS